MKFSFFHFKWIHWFFRIHFWRIFRKFLRNVTLRILDMYLYRNSLSHKKKISRVWTNSCTVIDLIFFFKTGVLKNEKIHTDSEKSINSFKMKTRICYLIIYWIIILFTNLIIIFRHYYHVRDFFDMGDFFQFFVISQNTEILFESNYWLGIYVPYIFKWIV